MAISQAAGTEIIRSATFETVNAEQNLIVGEQHHIYTVLSIIINCRELDATSDVLQVWLRIWDAKAGATGSGGTPIYIFEANPQALDTYVWNDKFSFNGYEPTGISGTLDTAAEQTAIAAQGGSVANYLRCTPTHGNDNYDVHITFIDQNNA
mgnify:CR=1 FL=1